MLFVSVVNAFPALPVFGNSVTVASKSELPLFKDYVAVRVRGGFTANIFIHFGRTFGNEKFIRVG